MMGMGIETGESEVTTADESTTSIDMASDSGLLELSDEELVERTRTGSLEAVDELWKRHAAFGAVAASALAGPRAEEVNADAWVRLVEDIRDGGKFRTGFRPYLYSFVQLAGVAPAEPAPIHPASETMWTALETMPARWQEVLWYLDVEQMSPDDVSLLTGQPIDSITATQGRARRGLRDAWLKTSADDAAPDSQCRWVLDHARAYLKKTLPEKDAETVNAHLESCENCRDTLLTARTMGSQAPELLLTAVAGTTAGAAILAYINANGPIVIDEDPLPEPVVALFAGSSLPLAGAAAGAGAAAAAVGAGAAGAAAGAGAAAAGAATAAPPSGSRPSEEEIRRSNRHLTIFLILAVLFLLVLMIIAAVVTGGSKPVKPTPGATTTATSATPTPTQTPTVQSTPTPPGGEQTTTPTEQPTDQPTDQPTPTETATQPTTPNTYKPPPANPHASATITGVNVGSGGWYPIVSGTAEPGDTVTVRLGGGAYTVTADARGTWTLSGPYPGMGAGPQSVSASAAQNPIAVTTSFTLAAPPTPQISSTASQVTLTLYGIPGASVQVFADGTQWSIVTLNGAGAWSGAIVLSPGTHNISTRYMESGRYGPTSGQVPMTSH